MTKNMPNKMHPDALVQGLIDFLHASPTPFHATAEMARQLQAAGFERLNEADAWRIQPGGRYFLTRNQSSIIGFVYGQSEPLDTGMRMLGAHTDSPCLKVKPRPELLRVNYQQLGVEVYGGVLLGPWFDRDLSMAGRVSYLNDAGQLHSALINFVEPVACIPSLAIHLDRGVNDNRNINAQKDIVPLLMQTPAQQNGGFDFRALLAEQLRREQPALKVARVLDYEISLYDSQPAALVGLQQDFIAGARLDNLLSCYLGLQSLLAADNQHSCLLVCTDHEEVGSASACGAKGPMLQQFLERLLPDTETRLRILDRSLMISADNAHGIHPNFMDRHDENHGPLLNAGPVIKINANQRYATASDGSALFRLLCEQVDVPVQQFVARTDMGCGSTIGPVVASEVGVKTLDIGLPTFAMHSIRELAGSRDLAHLYKVFNAFFAYGDPLAPTHTMQGEVAQ